MNTNANSPPFNTFDTGNDGGSAGTMHGSQFKDGSACMGWYFSRLNTNVGAGQGNDYNNIGNNSNDLSNRAGAYGSGTSLPPVTHTHLVPQVVAGNPTRPAVGWMDTVLWQQ